MFVARQFIKSVSVFPKKKKKKKQSQTKIAERESKNLIKMSISASTCRTDVEVE